MGIGEKPVATEAEFALWADDHARQSGVEMGREWADKLAQILASKKHCGSDLTAALDRLVENLIAGGRVHLQAQTSLDVLSIDVWEAAVRRSMEARLRELRPLVLAEPEGRQ